MVSHFVAYSCLPDIHFLLLSLFYMLIFSYGNSDADNFTKLVGIGNQRYADSVEIRFQFLID